MKNIHVFVPVVTHCVALIGMLSHGASLTLDEDRMIDVPAGETVTYRQLLGDGHTLTKTGGGQLVFNEICNAMAVIDVRGGGVRVRTRDVPAVVTEKAVLHLDAEHGLQTYEEDGTNFVSRWNDVRPSQTTYYALGKPFVAKSGALPFLREPGGSTNTTGRMVVETGPSQKLQPSLAAYFAIENSPQFAEAFVVAMDTEDVKSLVDCGYTGSDGRASPFVGMSLANWLRGNRSVTGVNSAIAQQVTGEPLKIANGSFELDGRPVDSTLPYPDGFHVLNVRPTDSLCADYLSSDRAKYATGGLRYGSVILFAEPLTDEERADVTDYLTLRWKGAENVQHVERVQLAAGTTFDVDSDVRLVVGNLVKDGTFTKRGDWTSNGYGIGADVTKVDVREGRYDGRVFVLPKTWMHVDASQADTLQIEEVNGTNMVIRWNDADGGSHYAKSSSTANPPFLSAVKLNDMPVVDFGSFSCGTRCPEAGRWGGALYWDGICSGIRDVFTVAMDTEDLKAKNPDWEADSTNVAYTRASPFVGNTKDAHFYRGNRSDPATENSKVTNTGGNTSTYTGSIDGGGYNATKDTPYPDGFHVLHIKTNRENSNGDSFTVERYVSKGGQRIAEFMVCDEEVSPDDAAKTINYMRAKWFRAGTNELSLVDVSVAAGAELDFEKLAVTGSLNLDGTLDVTEVGTAAIRVTGCAGRVKGNLKLADAGTLTVDWPREMFREFQGREVRILGFDTVEGGLSGWAVNAPAGVLRDVTLKADGIYATPQPKGLILIFR